MHRNIALVALLVFLEATHSFGYVIRRKQESGDESMIEDDIRLVENRRRDGHAPQLPEEVAADKASVFAGKDAETIQDFSWNYDQHLSDTIDDLSDEDYKAVYAMICKNYLVHVEEGSLTVKRHHRGPKHNRNIGKDVLSLMNNANVKTYFSLTGFGKPQKKSKSTEKEKYVNAMRDFAMFRGLRVDEKLCSHAGELIVHIAHVLKKKSTAKRCGDPDLTKGEFGEENSVQKFRRKRYTTIQSRWEKSTLTYKIMEHSANSLSTAVQEEVFAKAFKMWSDAAPGLKITEGSTELADIQIRFVRGAHGDDVPFDGKGLVVAHAFYPESGLLHFDDDEVFTTGGQPDTVDLLSVAAHEIGHALGLAHSSSPTSIMYPEYLPHSENLALSQDDVQGIQNLYPSNESDCVDQFWCVDILQDECSFFKSYCKVKCGEC